MIPGWTEGWSGIIIMMDLVKTIENLRQKFWLRDFLPAGIFFQSWLRCFLFYIIAKKVYQMWIFAYWLPINYCTRKYKGSQGVAWSNNYSRFVQHVEIVINFSLLETSQWRLISVNKKLNWNLQKLYNCYKILLKECVLINVFKNTGFSCYFIGQSQLRNVGRPK